MQNPISALCRAKKNQTNGSRTEGLSHPAFEGGGGGGLWTGGAAGGGGADYGSQTKWPSVTDARAWAAENELWRNKEPSAGCFEVQTDTERREYTAAQARAAPAAELLQYVIQILGKL